MHRVFCDIEMFIPKELCNSASLLMMYTMERVPWNRQHGHWRHDTLESGPKGFFFERAGFEMRVQETMNPIQVGRGMDQRKFR
jgi:hypothetical protein